MFRRPSDPCVEMRWYPGAHGGTVMELDPLKPAVYQLRLLEADTGGSSVVGDVVGPASDPV